MPMSRLPIRVYCITDRLPLIPTPCSGGRSALVSRRRRPRPTATCNGQSALLVCRLGWTRVKAPLRDPDHPPPQAEKRLLYSHIPEFTERTVSSLFVPLRLRDTLFTLAHSARQHSRRGRTVVDRSREEGLTVRLDDISWPPGPSAPDHTATVPGPNSGHCSTGSPVGHVTQLQNSSLKEL